MAKKIDRVMAHVLNIPYELGLYINNDREPIETCFGLVVMLYYPPHANKMINNK